MEIDDSALPGIKASDVRELAYAIEADFLAILRVTAEHRNSAFDVGNGCLAAVFAIRKGASGHPLRR